MYGADWTDQNQSFQTLSSLCNLAVSNCSKNAQVVQLAKNGYFILKKLQVLPSSWGLFARPPYSGNLFSQAQLSKLLLKGFWINKLTKCNHYRETLFEYNKINYNWVMVAFLKNPNPPLKIFGCAPVVKYKSFAFFWNLCDPCMSVHALLLLSCVHSLELGLDLENSLDRWEGERALAFIHGSQRFWKKVDGLYLTIPHQMCQYCRLISK